jgi:DNA polymerase III epsilon subunit-like protein
MAPFIAFDTETTGLPKTRNAKFSNLDSYEECRLLSVALVEFDSNFNEIGSYYKIVKPEGYPVKATEIHGITQEQADQEGEPFEDVMSEILSMFSNVSAVVGHNLNFDLNVLASEMARRNIATDFLNTFEHVCTLKICKNIFYRRIKLSDLYFKLFNKRFDGAHNALADARAAGEVLIELSKFDLETKPIEAKKVWLKVSDVATMIGVSTFKPQMELIETIWQKYSPKTFKGQTKEQEQITAFENSSQEIQDFVKIETTISSEVQGAFTKAKQAIEKDENMSKREKTLVSDYMRKTMYTNHGIKTEDKVELKGEISTDETFYKIPICTIHGTQYILCGRVDRVETLPDGSLKLIEIKNRTRNLFNKLRDYENIQVQVYLQMNSMWKSAVLVEQYNNEKKLYSIERDTELWKNKILPGIENFCKVSHHYMST